MTESDSVVRLEKVSKAYTDGQTFYALNEIDVAVSRGERVAIMGPSGSGKSTMLNLICGLDIPTSGRVWVGGIELSQLTEDERTRLRRGKNGKNVSILQPPPPHFSVAHLRPPLHLRRPPPLDAEKQAQTRRQPT